MVAYNDRDRYRNDQLLQNAIEEGDRKVNREEPKISYNLTPSQLSKIQKLAEALRTSTGNLPNSAISYFHYLNKRANSEDWENKIDREIRDYQQELKEVEKKITSSKKERHKYSKEFIPSPDISKKLEELDMTDRVGECIFVGINLMHKNLIENPLKQTSIDTNMS